MTLDAAKPATANNRLEKDVRTARKAREPLLLRLSVRRLR